MGCALESSRKTRHVATYKKPYGFSMAVSAKIRKNGFEVGAKSKDCLAAIEVSNSLFPDYKDVFSPVRKIDWFLWRFDRNELIEMGAFIGLLVERCVCVLATGLIP